MKLQFNGLFVEITVTDFLRLPVFDGFDHRSPLADLLLFPRNGTAAIARKQQHCATAVMQAL